ncbi:hypothetical protein BHM03_00009085 [Ensete ventricosum]|nr:hypothetical protein BHM03_00009085 [Ensete ventricosum]
MPKLPPFLGPYLASHLFAAWAPKTNGDGRLPTHPNDDAYAPTNPPFCLLPPFDLLPHLLRSGHRAIGTPVAGGAMEEALEMARAKDTKERMAGVERLHQVLEATTKSLSTAEVTSLVDACMDLLKDSNFRVSQGALQALSAAAVLSGEHLKLHFNGLVPAVVERLGDGKQPVRDAARQLLITLMELDLNFVRSCTVTIFLLLWEMEKIATTLVPEKDWSLRIAAMQRAESLMLRNCKVARVLPRIADAAKNDKSAVLRARCCEYALLILEYWADAPEIHRSADLYEDLIKCCVADAMSEFALVALLMQYAMLSKHARVRSILPHFAPSAGVDAPSARDPLVPSVSSPDLFSAQSSLLVDSIVANITKGSSRNGGSNMSEVLSSQVQQARDPLKLSHLSHVTSDTLSSLSLSYLKRSSERLQEISGSEDNVDLRLSRRLPSIHTDRQYLETPYKDSGYRDPQNSNIPNFQRPLLRKQVTGRTLASSRSSFDDSQIPASEMSSYMDGPASLNDALTEGLSPSSDWVARVSAFNYLWSLLQQGPKGILEIMQNFEKVMKLFFRYLDDPHHKVAQAAFSTLAEIIPSCRKPFESYLERTLPHVFSRLIDPKELVRQPCSATLEIVGKTYNIDSLLPALLRSLDEQRSPKAKLAVIQFANNSFNKHTINADGYSNNGFLKLWLAKLAPLVNDKNVRLKEASISGIISVYSHFDPAAVLNFILSLSVEEQNSLRRALKQYTPRIEVDLMNFLQNKKERQRSKPFYDQSDAVGTSSEEGYVGASKKSHHFGRYSAGSVDDEGGKKWSFTHESTQLDVPIGNAATDESRHPFENVDDCGSDPLSQGGGSANNCLQKTEMAMEHESCVVTPRLDISRLVSSDGHKFADMNHGGEISISSEFNHEKLSSAKAILPGDSGPSIPQLLHRVCKRCSSSKKYLFVLCLL